MEVTLTVIGVDVGGTNTDAVIVDRSADKASVISCAKTLTTADVNTGVGRAIHLALINSRKENRILAVQQVNIGTTHFINAIVEGKRLTKVAVIRLCGTASRAVAPFSDIPKRLTQIIRGSVFMLNGGYQFDGTEITPLNEKEIRNTANILKSNGERNIVISGIFSPLIQDHENRVADIIRGIYPEASITACHEIGTIGLLERENAAILNECIKPLCLKTISGLRSTLDDMGLTCPIFLTQNDGTVLNESKVQQLPVLTFASGATNSMRGAAFLTGIQDAIVVDIGGTSMDVGMLLKGFPREASSEVKVGGIRTNFRMPDVVSIGLGGGSYIKNVCINGKELIRVGPQSAGYLIDSEALVFAKDKEELETRVVTATDIAVAADIANVGVKEYVLNLDKNFVQQSIEKIQNMIGECVDKVRINNINIPLILVGGGSILVDKTRLFDGVSEIVCPDYFDVANAVGAALCQISTNIDMVLDLEKYVDMPTMNSKLSNVLRGDCNATTEDEKLLFTQNIRKEFLLSARKKAFDELCKIAKQNIIAAGATKETIKLIDKEDTSLSYIPGNVVRMKIKLVGDLKVDGTIQHVINESVYNRLPCQGQQNKKQTVTMSGIILEETESKTSVKERNINKETGEWLVSEYDIECISIGTGILGCGGGGSPHIGRLLALQMLERGKIIKIVEPSKYLENADPENDLVIPVGFMGAPVILYEKLVSGNEIVGALQCMQDLYQFTNYSNGDLEMPNGIEVKVDNGIKYIDDFTIHASSLSSTDLGEKKIIGLMSAEIGGMNGIESLITSATMGIPVLDCDGIGRAFPELQMFAPLIYGCKPYPSILSDDKGRKAVVLYADGPKRLENHFRDVVVRMGCSGAIVLSYLRKDEVLNCTVQHSLSHAWRIGDAVLKARTQGMSPVRAVMKVENGKLIIYGKITDVFRETSGGFNKGKLSIAGLDDFDGKTVSIEFQNEFLIAKDGCNKVLVCVPDLITLMDADTAQPLPTEEVKFGLRVVLVAMPVTPVMSTDQALKFVGPQAFGYKEDFKYLPINEFKEIEKLWQL